VRPDVVVFLGDLLDEGSVGSDADYLTYVKRFKSVFSFPDHVKVGILLKAHLFYFSFPPLSHSLDYLWN
jgi:hypothetical protein